MKQRFPSIHSISDAQQKAMFTRYALVPMSQLRLKTAIEISKLTVLFLCALIQYPNVIGGQDIDSICIREGIQAGV